jgi:hypothetical protein
MAQVEFAFGLSPHSGSPNFRYALQVPRQRPKLLASTWDIENRREKTTPGNKSRDCWQAIEAGSLTPRAAGRSGFRDDRARARFVYIMRICYLLVQADLWIEENQISNRSTVTHALMPLLSMRKSVPPQPKRSGNRERNLENGTRIRAFSRLLVTETGFC